METESSGARKINDLSSAGVTGKRKNPSRVKFVPASRFAGRVRLRYTSGA